MITDMPSGSSVAGSPGPRHHAAGSVGRAWWAARVKASQPSTPPAATAAAAAAKTPASQNPVASTSA